MMSIENQTQINNVMASERGNAVYKARVLVVEDEFNLLTGIRDILELDSYEVLTAQNGADGLALLRDDPNNPPDIIVSDVMMPHMDGYEFLSEVRKEDRWVTIPFIFLTARSEREDRHKGAKLGADAYLTKPFDAEDLLVSVDTSLRRTQHIQRVQSGQVSDVKRQILTILNHEFRTPLTLVVAYADMLRDSDPGQMSDGELMQFLRGVNSGAARLRRLIENFILLVEVESGDADQTFKWRAQQLTDIQPMIHDARQQADLGEARPRRIEITIPESTPTLFIDPQYLTVAIREMLDNAAKFSEDDGLIELRAYCDDEWLHIEVQDYGRGVPEHEQENIWQRFYQINRELYEDQGAGSGLALVDGIVKMHGGTRRLHSVDGEGSTFSIAVPLHKADADS